MSPSLPFDLGILHDEARRLARAAGEEILRIYGEDDFAVEIKGDDSPLTAADLASQRVIVAGLSAVTPEIPVISEESKNAPYDERAEWSLCWLVDPLDGTKEFVKRNGEFTVNIALLHEGLPILGVVYAPVLDRTYSGIYEQGAWRSDGAGGPQPIRAGGTGEETLVVVASRSHPSPELASFLGALPAHRLTSMGSSLKLCLVAEGAADLYPRLGPTMEWDTGAAHAVVLAAGGDVVDTNGNRLTYNRRDLLNPHFIVHGTRDIPWQDALP